MGSVNHHRRYIALKLSDSNFKRRILSISKLFIFLAIVVGSSTGSTAVATIESDRSLSNTRWPQVSLPINQPANSMIVDENDGSVFIAVNSDIFKLTNELKLATTTYSNVTTTNNINEPKLSKNGQHDDDLVNKLLSLFKFNNKDLLLSCWQAKNLNLKCWLNKVTDLRSSSLLFWGKEQTKAFKIGQFDRFVAQITQNSDNNNDLLLTTSRLTPVDDVTNPDNSSLQVPQLPAISRFRIVNLKAIKHYSLDEISVLPYKNRINDFNLLFDYVYTFNYENHTYFILNDIQKPVTTSTISPSLINNSKDVKFYTRIARICNNDVDLTSYTEISLTCNNQVNIYSRVAYIDKSEASSSSLHIIFEEPDEISPTMTRKLNSQTSLCSYSMSFIEDYFHEIITSCNKGNSASVLLNKMHLDSTNAPLCQSNPSDPADWCTSKLNLYIDGTSSRYNVGPDTHINLGNLAHVNFLYTIKQGPKKVLFIGTKTGHLTKMGFDDEPYYTVDLNNNHVENYRVDEKFKPKNTINETLDISKGITHYSTGSRYIYSVNRRGQVSQLDIDACYYYQNCRACLGTRDPLECVWCGGVCSKKQDCGAYQPFTLTCPPSIRRFHPSKIPLSGNTRLKIEGDNFGTASASKLAVKLGNEECSLIREISTSEVLYCLVRPNVSSVAANVTLNVEVLDESTHIYSNGSSNATYPVRILPVDIFGLHPTYGYQTGDNVITIYGENLDAGLNRTVLLGKTRCQITKFQSDSITCIAKAGNSQGDEIRNQTIENQNLRVFIDETEQPLRLKDQFDGYNLSSFYRFELLRDDVSNVPYDGSETSELESSHIGLQLFLIALLIILSVVIYVYRAKISFLKLKIPNAFKTKSDTNNISDAKVSFKNPQSYKFAQSTSTNPNGIGGSITGLVKLNGGLLSSSDYFGKPEQLEHDQPLMTSSFLDNELVSILVQEKILIDKNRLTLGHVLGSGQFGRVYKGFLKIDETGEHTAVAVKTLHNRSSWDDATDNKAFLEEGLMMKDFQHENVLTLIGVAFDSSGLPMVITPFMLYGDLKSYISDEASSPTVRELIEFGIQVAKGMAYLSNLKFVHRDLAARNCMLDENLVVKIADFGLSRDIYESDYYSSDNMRTKLPVKWMALESLETRVYSTKTDVWSYGVLLWELMTRGVVPYPDVDNFDLYSYLAEGRRMTRTRYCPVILYKIMLSCWERNPTLRPTFNELVVKVSDVINQLLIAKDGQQKVIRDTTYCEMIAH